MIGWRERYWCSGLDGLQDEPRAGRPREHDHRSIVAATLKPPPKKYGVTHWSSRLLGRHLGISNGTIAKAWRAYGVAPWRDETLQIRATRPASSRFVSSRLATTPRSRFSGDRSSHLLKDFLSTANIQAKPDTAPAPTASAATPGMDTGAIATSATPPSPPNAADHFHPTWSLSQSPVVHQEAKCSQFRPSKW